MVIPILHPTAGSANAPVQKQSVVRIAVLDTGSKIPDHYNASVRYFDARPGIKAIEEVGPSFRSEHGTWVTNAILENYDGPVEIFSYRVEGACRDEIICEINTTTLTRAAMHAWLQGANIIQISSYGEIGPALEGVLSSIASKGIHVVMSAGNESGVSPLLPLARLNPDYIHIVGSLSRSSQRSFFSARDDKNEGPLLRWRLGEKVPSRTSSGRLTHVTGTSYAASIMSADLARDLAKDNGRILAVAAAKNGPRPPQTQLELIRAMQEGKIKPEESDVRIALAEAGEMEVTRLTASEISRMRSRAIRPSTSGGGTGASAGREILGSAVSYAPRQPSPDIKEIKSRGVLPAG